MSNQANKTNSQLRRRKKTKGRSRGGVGVSSSIVPLPALVKLRLVVTALISPLLKYLGMNRGVLFEHSFTKNNDHYYFTAGNRILVNNMYEFIAFSF